MEGVRKITKQFGMDGIWMKLISSDYRDKFCPLH
jgi:hypothetical protein